MNAVRESKTMADIGQCAARCRQDECKRLMRRAMVELVGPDARYDYEALADLLDVEERTLKAYALGECLPSLPIFLRLCAAGGTGFTSRFLELIGQVSGSLPHFVERS